MALNDSLDEITVRKFSDSIFELAQQTKARLRGIVEMEKVDAKELMLDRVGNAEVQELVGRSPLIVHSDLDFDRRRLMATPVGVPFLIDKWDEKRTTLGDPNNIYAKRAAQALERHFDRVVVRAALATVYTGEHGTTPVTAATDGVQVVDATAGLTYDKLLEINENFQQYEVGTEMPIRKFLLLSEQEHTRLMKEGTLTSGDFSRQYVVDKGQMVRALDFEIIVFGSAVPQPMLAVAGGERACLAIAMGGITVGISETWNIDIQPVNNRWRSRQVLADGIIGAVRMEAVRVQQIRTTAA